jgi:hypothetical protein
MINNIKYCYYIFDYIDNSLDTIENEKNGEILLIYLHNFNNYCCLQIIFVYVHIFGVFKYDFI